MAGKVGRPPGRMNSRTVALLAIREAYGKTPLEFMLDRMVDEEEDMRVRMEAARTAAPYCHPKLSSVTIEASNDNENLNKMTNRELAHYLANLNSRQSGISTKAIEAKP